MLRLEGFKVGEETFDVCGMARRTMIDNGKQRVAHVEGRSGVRCGEGGHAIERAVGEQLQQSV